NRRGFVRVRTIRNSVRGRSRAGTATGARGRDHRPRGADLDDGRATGRVRNQRDAHGGRRGGGVGCRRDGGCVGRRGLGRRVRWRGRVCFVVPRRLLAA